MKLRQAVERLLKRRPILIAVDFDGTLAPLVEHPSMAEPDASAVEILAKLASRPGIEVAVVSGRALSDLAERLGGVPGATLIGEHGNDVGEVVSGDPVIDQGRHLVESLVSATPGSSFEVKPSSVSFHYRNVEAGAETHPLGVIRAWAEVHPEVRVLEGKKVIELSVARRNKGDAIEELAGEGTGILYIGDDTTDETVFALLGPDDVGVKVGPGDTAAAYRVSDVGEVVELLEVIDLIST